MSFRRSTLTVAALSLSGSVLGLGREWFVAYYYGANSITDAYFVAAIVPDTIAGWLSYAFTNSLVPVLKSEFSRSGDSAKKLATNVVVICTILLVILTLTSFFFRSLIVSAIAPGFSVSEHERAVRLLATMTFGVFLSGLSGVLWGIHNAFGSFTLPAIVNVVYNGTFLLVSFVLARAIGVEGLAVGYVCGVLGKVLIQGVPLLFRGFFKDNWKVVHHPRTIEVLRLMIPIVISTGIGSLNTIVDRILASSLPNGDISVLNYVSKLGLLPVGFIGVSMATTLYTRFVDGVESESEAVRNGQLIVSSTIWVLFFGIIIGGEYLLFGMDIVQILFVHGRFNLTDLHKSLSPLRVYAISEPLYILSPVVTHLFFAKRSGRLISISSMVTVLLNVIGSILLVRPLGITGLVLANTISQGAYVILLLGISLVKYKVGVASFVWAVIKNVLPPAGVFLVIACLSFLSLKHLGPVRHAYGVAIMQLLIGNCVAVLVLVLVGSFGWKGTVWYQLSRVAKMRKM